MRGACAWPRCCAPFWRTRFIALIIGHPQGRKLEGEPSLDPAPAMADRKGLKWIEREVKMSNSVAGEELKAFIERIERLEEEKAALAGDLRDVYSEAKSNGFDTKIMRKIISLRRKDHAERQEEEALMELYLAALGMQG